YWVVALFYKLFGVSATSERLAIALGAILMIATAFALGRLLYSTEAGLYAALALAIAPRFLMFSRRIMIDVTVAMWMAAALLFFALAEARPNERKRYLILMYVAVGLGVLTKGPAAALRLFLYPGRFRGYVSLVAFSHSRPVACRPRLAAKLTAHRAPASQTRARVSNSGQRQ